MSNQSGDVGMVSYTAPVMVLLYTGLGKDFNSDGYGACTSRLTG